MLERLELFLFAPEGGGWAYTYVQRPDLVSVLAVGGLVALVLLVWHRTERHIESRPGWVVLQWMVASLIVQWTIHAIAPFTLTAKLESVPANGFYSVAQAYSAGEFLRQFNAIAGALPMHVQANLPGKVLLFHALGGISWNPSVLAALLVLLSTAGGGLVYLVAWQWYRDRRLAVVAAILYLVLPARIFFLPLLNTVSPLLMLAALALVGAWTQSRTLGYAVALGPLLYLLMLFDPLPAAAGLCGVAVLVQRRDVVAWRAVAGFSAVVAAGMLATHLAMLGVFSFDLLSAYRFAIRNATEFNLEQQRPYWFWVFHNLKDFAIAIGVAQAAAIVLGWQRWLWRSLPVGLAIVACLLIVDLLGVNRAEVQRLWIFLAVLFQLLAACACAADRRLTAVVIGVSVAQAALCMRSIAWVVP